MVPKLDRASLTILWGIPGAGKSTFACWLASNKGFTHIDTDAGSATAVDHAWRRTLSGDVPPQIFVQAVARHGHLVVLEYGLYVASGAIALLQRLQEVGADPWWFDGNRLAAFAAWRAENRRKHRDFTDEKWHEGVNVINTNWRMVEQFFGRQRILRTIEVGPTHVPPETTYASMRRVTG
jgi:hypothetical protein